MHTVSMIVAESRSHWLPWFRAWQGQNDQLAVVAQHEDEPHDELVKRVLRRARQLQRDGARFERIALVGNDHWSKAALASRSWMVRWLSGLQSSSGEQTRIVLDPSSMTQARARLGLRALASAVAERGTPSAAPVVIDEPPQQAA